ncbi:unnamed protein product [Periconia digitata]|uniref:Protein phosphatase 1 regulatory subunit 7 n=1 Tax=Periconia digitata TaxID=1303443 RepID=A0A9W4UIP2_9PLEO|nr:unnamed protein product [Periconia digitata]
MAGAPESPDTAPPPVDVHDATADNTLTPDTGEKKDKPRDSKGWDGKLRLNKSTSGDESPVARLKSDTEGESEDDGPPPDQLAADEDLLDDVPADEDEIDLVHLRISSIPALKLERFEKLRRLCLRQNQIQDVELPDQFAPTLTELDLYDNLISHIRGLDAFTQLEILDFSFNKIKHIKRIGHLTKLRDLFFVQNKISTIENLEGLTNLRQIELGANRIREIQNLDTLTGLEQLWLGKNKITELKGLSNLTNLKILSIQSNRLTSMSGISGLTSLEELYVSHNAITDTTGLENNANLQIIDISSNPIEHLTNIKHLSKLEEFWASNCKLGSFEEIEQELGPLKELQTVYFEGNPLQRRQPALYRNKVKLAVPHVKQIDATFVRAT